MSGPRDYTLHIYNVELLVLVNNGNVLGIRAQLASTGGCTDLVYSVMKCIGFNRAFPSPWLQV